MTLLLLITLAAAPAKGPPDPLSGGGTLQITGWSPDATRFSVRSFELFEGDDGMDPPEPCPGYVDHEGKKFTGRLVLAAYELGKLVQSWVVQDFPKCTPPKKAKETLDAAKAKFLELGIDLNAKGTTVACKSSCDLGGGAKLVLENTTRRTSDEEEMAGKLEGRLRATLETGSARAKLWEKDIKERFELTGAGSMKAGFAPVEVSPGGKAFLLRAYIESSGMRGGYTLYIPCGLYRLVPVATGG